MSTLPLQVDVEELVIQHVLRQNTQLANLLGGQMRVYTEVPWDQPPAFPLVTVERITSQQGIPDVLWLDIPLLQVDAWATTRKAAWRVAATAEAVLFDSPGSYPIGQITKVEEITGLAPLRDPDRSDLRRVMFQVRVYVHPIAPAS